MVLSILNYFLLKISLCLLLLVSSITVIAEDLQAHTCSTKSKTKTTPVLPDVPTIQLHNGVEMPLLITGTAQLATIAGRDPTLPPAFTGMIPEQVYRQVELALQSGVRAFDTAHIYRSSRPMGAVLGEWWRTAQLQGRPEVWITSKLFHPNATDTTFGITQMEHMYNMTAEEVRVETRKQLEQNLIDLGVGYLDLMLLHWPSDTVGKGTPEENRQRRLAAWRVLEDAYENKGWLRAIGVSNFSPKHCEDLMADGARIRPMVNQFEASILLQHSSILEYCLEHGIVPQAYSPLGRGIKELPPQVAELAVKYQKDVGQIAFRYLYQLGYSVVYLTNSAERLVSNTRIFDFELTGDEMNLLNSFNRPDGGWGLPSPFALD